MEHVGGRTEVDGEESGAAPVPFSAASLHARVRLARHFFRFCRLLLFVLTGLAGSAFVTGSIRGSTGVEGVGGCPEVDGEEGRGVRGEVPKVSSNSLSRTLASISIVRRVEVDGEEGKDVRGDVPKASSNSLSRTLGSISIVGVLGGEEGAEGEGEGDGDSDGDGEVRGDIPKKSACCSLSSSSLRVSIGPRSNALY